jgi:hypothetical protein
MQMHIVYVEILGNYNANVASPHANMHVHVRYLNVFQSFNSYDKPVWWYLCFALLLSMIMGAFMYFVVGSGSSMRIREKIHQILAPALKGCLYTTVTGGLFFLMMNEIVFRTNFSSVASLYGD